MRNDGPRGRRDFSPREEAYIRTHAREISWAQIARDLGRLYPEDNGGHRSRGAVQAFGTTDPEALVAKVLKVRKPLYDQATARGLDLNEVLERALSTILKKPKNAK